MDKFNDDADGILVAKGDSEKKKIKDQIIKNQKDKIASFFKEFRGYCKNSTTKRKNEIDQLFRELEKTLTSSEKEEFIRCWKPDYQPLIIVSTIRQLQDIQNHLHGLDLSRVTFSPLGQHYQQFVHDNQIEDIFSQSTDFSNMEGLVDFPNGLQSNVNPDDRFLNQQYNFITRSTENGAQNSDVSQEIDKGESLGNSSEEVESSVTVSSFVTDDLGDDSDLIVTNYQNLSSIITDNGDVLPTIMDIKATLGIEVYGKILKYCETKEPVLFQLTVNYGRYCAVIDGIWRDGLLDLNQRDYTQTSIFTFLLIKNMDSLYKFLKFTKEIKLQDEVTRICSSDPLFRTLLEQKKRDASMMPISTRNRIDSVVKFCMGNLT